VGVGEWDHTPKVKVYQVVPPYNLIVNKGDPTRLISKGSNQKISRGYEQ